jgi:hypothetical protein
MFHLLPSYNEMNEKKKKANMHTSQLDFFFSHQKEFFF